MHTKYFVHYSLVRKYISDKPQQRAMDAALCLAFLEENLEESPSDSLAEALSRADVAFLSISLA